MDYLTKLDRFGKALESRSLDNAIIKHFNDVHTEAEAAEKYISELELSQLSIASVKRRTFEILAESKRLRKGIERLIKMRNECI